MLNYEKGRGITTLKDIVGGVVLFETELEAREAGQKNKLGKAYGFEIFEIGNGTE